MEKKSIKLSKGFTIALPIPPMQEGIIFIKGDNGSGKTTLMRLLTAKYNFDLGEFLQSKEQEERFKNESSLFFEESMIARGESLQKNLNYVNQFVETDLELQQELIRRFALTKEILKRRFKKCSTGEKKKFITLLNLSQTNKTIYYLDEPFENIDIASKAALLQVLKTQFSDNNNTLYLTTHNEEVLSTLKYVICNLNE